MKSYIYSSLLIGTIAVFAIRICILQSQVSPLLSPRKIVQFGWGEPDTDFLLAHISEMEQFPIDGVVFHLEDTNADGSVPPDKESFLRQAWGRRAYTAGSLAIARRNLTSTKFRRFTENFVRLNVTPGNVDWFDDFSPILNNIRLLASIARDGSARGILFDVEAYGFPLFHFQEQRYAAERGWDQYAAQVRVRGAEVMQAMQTGYPGLTVFLTFGPSLPYSEAHGNRASLKTARNGLMAPFFSGMIDAAKGGTVIVDGYETSYLYREKEQFENGKTIIRQRAPHITDNPEKYKSVIQVAFGLWLDAKWRQVNWNWTDPSTNFNTPREFNSALESALESTDKYVWIYSEKPRWWKMSSQEERIPAEYIKAIWSARARFEPLQ